MDISGTNIKHITMFDRQYTPESKQRVWRSHRPLYMGIVISAVFCLSALRRVRRFNFLCLHGVCGARQRSLRICKRGRTDGH